MHTSFPIVLVGAGGHAKVVIDALLASGFTSDRLILLDQNPGRTSIRIIDVTVKEFSYEIIEGKLYHVCVGENSVRDRLYSQIGGHPYTIVHPAASVSTSSSVKEGTFIAARCVVGPDSNIGKGCIVNHGAVVDHDVTIGEFCHIAPGAILGGGVRLGSAVFVGAGAILLPGVSIGNNTVIGAGAVVLRDLPSDETYVGVPARRVI